MAALDPERARALLLDIEGTTTPVDFVQQVLFPHARARVAEFLSRHDAEDAPRADLERLREGRLEDERQGHCPPSWEDDSDDAALASAVRYVHWLMDRDRKSTPLKSLQGRIWEHGYRTGELQGQVFEDVPPAFQRWRRQGRDLSIFSSGSVLAQRLLFTHTPAGDLTPLIGSYFDTTTGPKVDAESYRRIAGALARAPSEVLFLSDVTAELDAARRAGLQTALCVRSAEPATRPTHPVVRTFDEVCP